jgi:hypothetical protein
LLVHEWRNWNMNEKSSTPIAERVKRGQSAALGDTGNGDTGVPSDEQGISNRPGDVDSLARPATGDGDAIEIVGDSDDDAENEDDGGDEDELDEDEDEDEDEDDEIDDPEAEPGKPI